MERHIILADSSETHYAVYLPCGIETHLTRKWEEKKLKQWKLPLTEEQELRTL